MFRKRDDKSALQTLKATAISFTAGKPFDDYVEKVSSFVNTDGQKTDEPHSASQTNEGQLPQEDKVPFSRHVTAAIALVSLILMSSVRPWIWKLKRMTRPSVKEGYRRIEWECVSPIYHLPTLRSYYIANLIYVGLWSPSVCGSRLQSRDGNR